MVHMLCLLKIIKKHMIYGKNKDKSHLIYNYIFNSLKEEFIYQLEKMIMLLILSIIAETLHKKYLI